MRKPKPLTERQQQKRLAILHDMAKANGPVFWGTVHDRGHHFMTVKACVRRGYLSEPKPYTFALTEAGRSALRTEREGE